MADERMKIYKRQTEVINGRNTEKEALLHYACWCKAGKLYGTELYKALEIRLNNTIVFEVRNCKKIKEIVAELKQYYIEFDGSRYELYAYDYKDDKRIVQLKANMIV